MTGSACLLLVALIILVKSLPLVWHFRFFWALLGRRLCYGSKPSTRLTSRHLFLPSIVVSRSPITECDFNLHKSNSTYFTDLDISRAHLSGLLFAPMFLGSTDFGRCNLVVGAVFCVFRKEIKPHQPYELWTKIVSWDDKWIYMVTHFVSKGKFRPRNYIMSAPSKATSIGDDCQLIQTDEKRKAVLASAITRMVFKKGRLTIPPAKALQACGLLSAGTSNIPIPSEGFPTRPVPCDTTAGIKSQPLESRIDGTEWELDEVEIRSQIHLPTAQLQNGWDAVHGLFFAETCGLAKHKDLMW